MSAGEDSFSGKAGEKVSRKKPVCRMDSDDALIRGERLRQNYDCHWSRIQRVTDSRFVKPLSLGGSV